MNEQPDRESVMKSLRLMGDALATDGTPAGRYLQELLYMVAKWGAEGGGASGSKEMDSYLLQRTPDELLQMSAVLAYNRRTFGLLEAAITLTYAEKQQGISRTN